MSCTNCNKSNCNCSDNCPNKTSDITVFDCSLNVIEVPCDATLCDVLTLLEAYTTNMVNELSEMTSVEVSESNCIGLDEGTYSIQQIYSAINDAICNLKNTCPMTIDIKTLGGVLSATINGGVPPYTYLWEIQDDLNLIELYGDPTAETIMVSPYGESIINFGLVKLTITDAIGCTASDTFLKQGILIA